MEDKDTPRDTDSNAAFNFDEFNDLDPMFETPKKSISLPSSPLQSNHNHNKYIDSPPSNSNKLFQNDVLVQLKEMQRTLAGIQNQGKNQQRSSKKSKNNNYVDINKSPIRLWQKATKNCSIPHKGKRAKYGSKLLQKNFDYCPVTIALSIVESITNETIAEKVLEESKIMDKLLKKKLKQELSDLKGDLLWIYRKYGICCREYLSFRSNDRMLQDEKDRIYHTANGMLIKFSFVLIMIYIFILYIIHRTNLKIITTSWQLMVSTFIRY